ncbi:MAG: hypothetical protein Q8J84_04510 [Flavobacteriaceae bacterium]|nr:hypothetical protein [Flavobacteriaceae bacterium]
MEIERSAASFGEVLQAVRASAMHKKRRHFLELFWIPLQTGQAKQKSAINNQLLTVLLA